MPVSPYYDDGQVTLYHGDCREVLPTLTDVACAVTSPPYNAGMAYDEHDDTMLGPEYVDFARSVSEGLFACLVDGGRSWVNIGVAQFKVWLSALEEAGHVERFIVCWDYGFPTADTAWGSWETPSSPNLRHAWEPVICSYKTEWVRTPPSGYEKWRDKDGNWPNLASKKWTIPPGASNGKDHPAVMPIELARRCIRLSTWPGEVVVDPFAGTGTTLRAAKDLGRRAIGIELSEAYCEMTARRLGQEVLFGGVA